MSEDEDYESCALKIELLHNTYGLDLDLELQEWYDYKLILTYQKRLICSKNKLLMEFEKAFQKLNNITQQLKNAKLNREDKEELNQLWKS